MVCTNPFTGKPPTVVELGMLADLTGQHPGKLLDAIHCTVDQFDRGQPQGV